MTAEELWKQSGFTGQYEAWSFGGNPDKLAELVKHGIKTATCSALELYELKKEPIPKQGDYSVILDSADRAVCIIRTTRVYIETFDRVSAEHAFKEGEGDRSLEYWRRVHIDFFTDEFCAEKLVFHEKIKLICEEFELVFVSS